jgi:hypothetical protein
VNASRVALAWVMLGLFLLRVVGQVEAWLLAPDWLPPMEAWYSGLLPYPLLLPAQIVLLMGMARLAPLRTTRGDRASVRSARWNVALRVLATLYFAAMAVRLALVVATHGREFYLHGAIPVAFHWVLALFALAVTRPDGRGPAAPAGAPR